MKKYGGVNNQRTLDEIQEAYIVKSPSASRITRKRSKTSIFFGWLAYLVVSYIITDLFLMIVTDIYSRAKLPLWTIFLLPATPFILTLAFRVYATLYNKKCTSPEN